MGLGEALHRVVMGCKQVGHLLIELTEVILDHVQLFKRERQQPSVDRLQGRTAWKAQHNCSGVARKRGAASG